MTEDQTAFTRFVIQDPDDPDGLLLDLGTDLCERMGWHAGDQLLWTDNGNGSWTLSKKIPG